MGVFELVASSATEDMVVMTVSFCISSRNSRSAENSMNSHSTPMVMEKQNAAIAIYSGERLRLIRLSLFSRFTREKPIAAHRKPEVVCSMVSQLGY